MANLILSAARRIAFLVVANANAAQVALLIRGAVAAFYLISAAVILSAALKPQLSAVFGETGFTGTFTLIAYFRKSASLFRAPFKAAVFVIIAAGADGGNIFAFSDALGRAFVNATSAALTGRTVRQFRMPSPSSMSPSQLLSRPSQISSGASSQGSHCLTASQSL